MALTLTTLIAKQAEFLVNDLDNSAGEAPTTQQSTDQVNWALRTISRELYLFDSRITFTPTASTPIQLLRGSGVAGKRIVQPYMVTINGSPLMRCDGRNYGLWSMPELWDLNPKWQTGADGTPTLAVYKGNNELILYAPPTAAVVSAAQNYIAGQILAPDLSSSSPGTSDVPAIPEECHEAIAYLAAVLAAMPVATEGEQWKRLQEFNASWVATIDEIARENRDAMQSWGSTAGWMVPDYMEA